MSARTVPDIDADGDVGASTLEMKTPSMAVVISDRAWRPRSVRSSSSCIAGFNHLHSNGRGHDHTLSERIVQESETVVIAITVVFRCHCVVVFPESAESL